MFAIIQMLSNTVSQHVDRLNADLQKPFTNLDLEATVQKLNKPEAEKKSKK